MLKGEAAIAENVKATSHYYLSLLPFVVNNDSRLFAGSPIPLPNVIPVRSHKYPKILKRQELDSEEAAYVCLSVVGCCCWRSRTTSPSERIYIFYFTIFEQILLLLSFE